MCVCVLAQIQIQSYMQIQFQIQQRDLGPRTVDCAPRSSKRGAGISDLGSRIASVVMQAQTWWHGSLCFVAQSDCFENFAQTMDCAPCFKRRRRWNKAKVARQWRRPASASECVEKSSVDVRKRPSTNNEANMKRPASPGKVVVPCAETDDIDQTIQELLICEFKMRKMFAAGDLSTAQTTEYKALQTRQKVLTDEIWWTSIFRSPESLA